MIIQVLHCPHCQGTDIVRHGHERQWDSRYGTGVARQPSHGHQGTKKKAPDLQQVHRSVLHHLHPEQIAVDICCVEELTQQEEPASELDEMWSDVGKKAEPRWLWHAIEHQRGTVLAYVFGRRKDAVFLQLHALLEPFGIRRFYTDGWGAYERYIDPEQHQVGKENTQKIESKHLNLRTRIKRLVRRTICFSKTTTMHDLVIGLFINRYEFGRLL